MNLYSYSFPIKLEKGENLPEFTAPYTITSALYIEDSHYVGYTISDSNDNSVDVLNIFDLKEYVTTNPSEFTNVKIDEISGHLIFKSIQNLPHKESLEFQYPHEKDGINKGLTNLLEIAIMPRKFYKYENSCCKLTQEAIEYIDAVDRVPAKCIMPQPLSICNSKAITSCRELFSRFDFYDNDVDFSLVNLNSYLIAEQLFEKSKFKTLEVKNFNINPDAALAKFCSGIECDILSIEDCDFSEMSYFSNAFSLCEIDEFKSKGCNMKRLAINLTHHIFLESRINKLDLGLFENITVDDFFSLQTHLSDAKYEVIINEELLPEKLFISDDLMYNSYEYQEHEDEERRRRSYYRAGGMYF